MINEGEHLSYAYWPFPFLRSACSRLLPIFILGCLHFSYWFISILIYFRHRFFDGYGLVCSSLPPPFIPVTVWCHLLLFHPSIILFQPLASYSLNLPCPRHTPTSGLYTGSHLSLEYSFPEIHIDLFPISFKSLLLCLLLVEAFPDLPIRSHNTLHTSICHPYPSLKKKTQTLYQTKFSNIYKMRIV